MADPGGGGCKGGNGTPPFQKKKLACLLFNCKQSSAGDLALNSSSRLHGCGGYTLGLATLQITHTKRFPTALLHELIELLHQQSATGMGTYTTKICFKIHFRSINLWFSLVPRTISMVGGAWIRRARYVYDVFLRREKRTAYAQTVSTYT